MTSRGSVGIDADGFPAAPELGLAALVHRRVVTSTMDEAHALAREGAVAGTLVVADEQTSGRGRAGRVWKSAVHSGVWMTLLERPADSSGLEVLSLRLGLAVVESLEALVAPDGRPLQLKWPNDVYAGAGKLAGVLVETRWRDGRPEWVAIGVGINLREPEADQRTASLKEGTTRADVLRRVVPSLRAAASRVGPLSAVEQLRWEERDLAIGRRITAPVPGVILGISPTGGLRVRDAALQVHEVRSGSIVFAGAGGQGNTGQPG